MLGRNHTEEAKQKISEAFKGEKHPNFGKPMSEKVRLKFKSQKGESHSNYGKKLSDETKRKIGEKQQGEDNHRSKLTTDDIKNIFILIEKGEKQYIIAEKFNVAPSVISRIKIKKRWQHVQ